jgi:hypothetical protein
MHTADCEILVATLLEYVAVGRTWITFEFVRCKDLLQVGEIILARLHLGVMAHMLERGRRTSIIAVPGESRRTARDSTSSISFNIKRNGCPALGATKMASSVSSAFSFRPNFSFVAFSSRTFSMFPSFLFSAFHCVAAGGANGREYAALRQGAAHVRPSRSDVMVRTAWALATPWISTLSVDAYPHSSRSVRCPYRLSFTCT